MRWKHPREYLERTTAGEPLQQENAVGAADLPFEFMMNALRLTRGFPTRLFEERTSLSIMTVRGQLDAAERLGLITRTHSSIAPTLRGQRFLNDLLQLFLREA